MCCVWKKPFSKEETENLCFHWQVVQGKSWSIHVSGHFHRFLAHWRINGYNFTTLKIHGLDFTIVYCSLSYHVIYNGWHKAPGENRRVFLQRKVLQAIEKGLCFGSSPLLPFKSKFVHFLVKRSTRWIIGGKILLFEEQLASVPSHLLYGLPSQTLHVNILTNVKNKCENHFAWLSLLFKGYAWWQMSRVTTLLKVRGYLF